MSGTTARLAVGTSGFSYKEWRPAFYPADLAESKFLPYYAARLSTVELNNTFYRFPSEKSLRAWAEETPANFTFAVKANQKITHIARLNDAGPLASDFVARCGVLGDKLGPILFQLPPNFKRDDARLAGFLQALPTAARYAFEFRHASWFDAPVLDILRRHGAALAISEDEKLQTPREITAPFSYVRLRREPYEPADLAAWSAWLQAQQQAGVEQFVYLKHDDVGASPEAALRLLALPAS